MRVSSRILAAIGRYTEFACKFPKLVLAALCVSALPAIILASRLDLRTDFKDLLPKDRRSVLELERVSKLIPSAGGPSLTVAIEGDDGPSMRRFADAVSERLGALVPRYFSAVDKSAEQEREFFSRNRFLYADLEDLTAVRDALHREVLKASGLDLDLEGGETLGDLRDRLDRKVAAADKFPDGYYVGENGKLLAIFATLTASFGDIDGIEATVDRVNAELKALNPEHFHPSLRATLTGEAVTGVEEYKDFRGDLLLSSVLCVTLVLVSIVVFYGRLRSLPIIGFTLLCGVAWTFGLARILVGYLNSSTAFLGSIVAGNGVNFAIILLARYFEERRKRLAPAEAMRIAAVASAPATFGAALAAGIAYGSLSLTSFRGFNQFGVIGGTGMALCWIATYLAIPPIATWFDRFLWFKARSERPWRDLYAAPFAALVAKIPRPLVFAGVLLCLCATALGTEYILGQPFEYYFGNLKNKARSRLSNAAEMDSRVSKNVRTEGTDGMAIIAEKTEQVPFAKAELLRRKRVANERCAAHPSRFQPSKDCSPIGEVVTADDLLPKQQEEKLALLREIRRLADRAMPLLDAKEREIALKHRPPDPLHTIGLSDLPPKLMRQFREREGRLGRILYVSHAPWVSVWHGEHLIAFSEAVEDLPLPGGEHIYGSGRAVIFADMIRSITADGKGAVAASLAGVAALVVLLFGLRRQVVAVLLTLLGGVALLLGFIALRGIKLNFLNFVALPITIGVGADYAINMVKRIIEEPTTPIESLVRTTGGAIILCSITTSIGYGALLLAQNRALNSFGVVAMVGEGTCIAVAILVLPAVVKLKAKLVSTPSAPNPRT